MIILSVLVLILYVSYNIIGHYVPSFISPTFSLLIACILCIIVIFCPRPVKNDSKISIFEPYRLFAVVNLFFFPLYAIFYLKNPWMGKWYSNVMS